MKERNDLYQCDICGNLVSVLKCGKGVLKCCGEDMIYLKPGSGDPASEKHIPYIEQKDETNFLIKTGKHPHPMVKAHFIGFIEVLNQDFLFRKYLYPKDKPEIWFESPENEPDLRFRSYCLIHGVFETLH